MTKRYRQAADYADELAAEAAAKATTCDHLDGPVDWAWLGCAGVILFSGIALTWIASLVFLFWI